MMSGFRANPNGKIAISHLTFIESCNQIAIFLT
nr:hypothetical protein pmam_446 [Pithovirus mammoth]